MKGLLIATLLGGIACGVFGVLLGFKHADTRATLNTTQTTLSTTKASLTRTKGELTETSEKLAATETTLTDTRSQLDNIQGQLTTAKQKVSDLESANKAIESEKAEAEKQLAEIKEQLGEVDVAGITDQLQKQEEQLAALEQEKSILGDELAKANEDVLKLRALLEREEKGLGLPPGVSGKIAKVNRDWNFVVLDIGYNSGVIPNGELVVYRGNRMVGRVKVTSASPDTSVANILPEWTKGTIRAGDRVLDGTSS